MPQHTLHTTHVPLNCTGTKNNTRIQKSQTRSTPTTATPPMTRVEKKIYLKNGEEGTTPHTTNTHSPMRIEKSNLQQKHAPSTHYTRTPQLHGY